MKKLLLLLPLLLGGCFETKTETTVAETETETDTDFIDFINLCVVYQFHTDYEETEIITLNTKQVEVYYLTDVYYRIEFENDIYKTEYISAVNDKEELILREIKNESNFIKY